MLTPLESIFSTIFYYKKRQQLPYLLRYYFPDNFKESVSKVPPISEDIIDAVNCEEWVDLFRNQLDCLFAETGRDRELDFNQEDEEEIEYYLWLDALKDLVRQNNLSDTVVNNSTLKV